MYISNGSMPEPTDIFCGSKPRMKRYTGRSIPDNKKHDFRRRLDCLKSLQDIGYQTGTGVMIGLPFQTIDDLAGDLIFMRDFNIDMCGMGPYIEHADTPLIEYTDELLAPG